MYSQSNSFLGGGNSFRPGSQPQPQYGNSFGQPGQQPGQQPSPFAPQPTGYGQPQAPLQQQYTGYPGLQQPQPQAPGQLQPQFTGFPGQAAPQQQPFQTGAPPPMPAIPQQFQQQFQQQQQQQQPPSSFNAAPTQTPQQPPASQQPPPTPMKPQPTGFSQMAASFRTGGAPAATPSSAPAPKSNKIPNIRLSFITAADQVKFETLFKSAVGDNDTTMSGEKARDLLMRSRLDGDALSHIWYADKEENLTKGTTQLISSPQDFGRYHTFRTASLPRVRPGYVPLQSQNDRPTTPSSASRCY